jgi:predicted Fe-S protein YdhL (DUF1289 family)
MSEIVQEEVQSPCIGVCSIDEASGYCQGCYRTTEEIKGWWNMSQPEQTQLVAELEQRQTQSVNFD